MLLAKASRRYVIPVVGDLHTNSTVALSVPKFRLDDGQKYEQGPVQKWIWDNWLDFWKTVGHVRKTLGMPPTIGFVNGESADDNYHFTNK